MDEEQRRIEVVVPDDQLSLAIGRRGQKRAPRLGSSTGWDIDILTEAEESERRQEEFRTRTALFIERYDVDDVIAHLLVTEGFTSSRTSPSCRSPSSRASRASRKIVAKELQQRARNFIKERDEKHENRRKEARPVADDVTRRSRCRRALRSPWLCAGQEKASRSPWTISPISPATS